MAKPTIVLIPGLWEGPLVFTSLAHALSSTPHSLPTLSVTLPSTGRATTTTSSSSPSPPPSPSSPANETLQADVRAIRAQIEPLVAAGKDVVLVMHSAGGFLGCNAVEGWARAARTRQGRAGGVKRLVFLAAGLLPEGEAHVDLPFMQKDGAGGMTCITPRTTLFSDLPDATAQLWLPRLRPQPAEGWNDVITYAAWKEVPSVYVLAEDDKLLPPEIQAQCAALAGSEVVRVKAGHMLMLTQESLCLEVILKAVQD